MIPFSTVVNRVFTGKICNEKEFDINLVSGKLNELVNKYDIIYDSENPVPSDDALADRIFEAAIEFYEHVGTYCPDTERRIIFSKDEILQALATAPENPVFGGGKDANVFMARKPECEIPPWCFVGAAGTPVSSEEIFLYVVQGYAEIPFANSITTPPLTKINGLDIRGNSPLEILATIRTAVLAKEAFRQAGRPGLPIFNGIATGSSAAGKIAGAHYLEPHHSYAVASQSEFKIDFAKLNEIAYLTSIGARISGETAPLLGGYVGGPATVAVANAAYHFHAIMVLRGSFQLTLPTHYNYGSNSSREMLWAISASSQAISRNSHFPHLTDCYVGAGPMTQMCFQEIAAEVITSIVSGASVEIVAPARGVHIDHTTPMEPKLAAEIAHASVGMSRKDANKIVNFYLEKYENQLSDAPTGSKYQDCYDIYTNTPCDEYRKMYKQFKSELKEKGLSFKF